jgi:hypothetical protein
MAPWEPLILLKSQFWPFPQHHVITRVAGFLKKLLKVKKIKIHGTLGASDFTKKSIFTISRNITPILRLNPVVFSFT